MMSIVVFWYGSRHTCVVCSALDRLESKGCVTSYLGNPTAERGGKSKRYYKLTDEGLAQLREIQKVYTTFWGDVPDLGADNA